jgi:hypothetical protein
MNWYSAHIVLALDADAVEGTGNGYSAREVCVLICANSFASARAHAEALGPRYEGQHVECPAGDGTARFLGVRKIVPCVTGTDDTTPPRELVEGVELTSVDLEFAEETDVERLLAGDVVAPMYDA